MKKEDGQARKMVQFIASDLTFKRVHREFSVSLWRETRRFLSFYLVLEIVLLLTGSVINTRY